MTGSQLRNFMSAQGISPENDFELDDVYECPTRAWFLGPFASAVGQNMERLGLAAYHANSNDCDKFDRRASQWAHDCQALTHPNSGAGLAVGDFFYKPAWANGGGHAIVCAVVYQDGKPTLVFLEPQNCLEAKLTAEEIKSCFGYIF